MSETVSNELIYKTLISLRDEIKRNTDRIDAFQEHLGAQQRDIGTLYRRDEDLFTWKESVDKQLLAIRAKLGMNELEH